MVKGIKTNSWHGLYDFFFYGLVRGLRPQRCVELGTYAGYDAYWMGLALKHNGSGQLDCYDLWEDYPYNHVKKKEAEINLTGLPIKLFQEEASTVYAHYIPKTVDLLMIDLSNDGLTYKTYLKDWYDKLADNGIILMEGGTEERDKIDWMIKYKKYPIREALKDKFISTHYNFYILAPFPGLTIFTRKERFDTDLDEG